MARDTFMNAPHPVYVSKFFLLVLCAACALSACSGSKRPREQEVRDAYEKDVRERFTRAAQWMPMMPFGKSPSAKDVKEGIEKIRTTEFAIVDSQTGEIDGVRFYRAQIKATILLPDGKTQAGGGWLRFEKTDKGWTYKPEGLRL